MDSVLDMLTVYDNDTSPVTFPKSLIMTKSSPQTLKVIRADDRVSDGVFVACKHLLAEIKKFKGQIWTVYKQNFKNSYYGSGLGVTWNFILPLIPVTVYLFLTKIKVFPSFEGVDSSTYLTFGVTIWFVFAGFIQIPISIVQSRNKDAMRTSLPLSTSIVSSFAGLAFDTLIRMILVLCIMVLMKSWPTWWAPSLFFIFIPGFFLFFGAGLILSIWNVIYRDVSRIVMILLQYGIFVSGVIFPLGSSDLAVLANKINPFAVFINATREIVFQGTVEDWTSLLIWSGFGILLFIYGCRLFYVMEFRIRDVN